MTLKLRLNPKDVGISVIYSSLSMGTILVSFKIVRLVWVLRFYDDDDDDSKDDDDNDGQKHHRHYLMTYIQFYVAATCTFLDVTAQ